jgi:predicted lactoylglutathione lyase
LTKSQALGFLFNRHVEDPDRNVWEIMWMDAATLAQTAQMA